MQFGMWYSEDGMLVAEIGRLLWRVKSTLTTLLRNVTADEESHGSNAHIAPPLQSGLAVAERSSRTVAAQ